MKKNNFRGLIAAAAALACGTMATQLVAADSVKMDKKVTNKSSMLDYTAVLPRGKTLPKDVFRFWAPYRAITADQAFDASGKLQDAPVDIEVRASALVLEYGITDDISFQLVVPQFRKNRVSLNSKKAQQTAIQGIAQGLAQDPRIPCKTVAECSAWIDAGNSLPVDLNLGPAVVPAGVPLKQAAILAASNAKAAVDNDGAIGLGDVEIGALYKAVETSNFMFAAGLGFRLPTGTFGEVDELDTGRGTTDLGLRLNLDYALTRASLLSWQHQFERMIFAGEKNQLGTSEKLDFERVGVRSHGSLQLGYNLGNLDMALKSLGVTMSANYDFDAETRIDGEVTESALKSSRRSQLYSGAMTFNINGLDYGIPGSLELEYTRPFQGKNAVATRMNGFILKGYVKF